LTNHRYMHRSTCHGGVARLSSPLGVRSIPCRSFEAPHLQQDLEYTAARVRTNQTIEHATRRVNEAASRVALTELAIRTAVTVSGPLSHRSTLMQMPSSPLAVAGRAPLSPRPAARRAHIQEQAEASSPSSPPPWWVFTPTASAVIPSPLRSPRAPNSVVSELAQQWGVPDLIGSGTIGSDTTSNTAYRI